MRLVGKPSGRRCFGQIVREIEGLDRFLDLEPLQKLGRRHSKITNRDFAQTGCRNSQDARQLGRGSTRVQIIENWPKPVINPRYGSFAQKGFNPKLSILTRSDGCQRVRFNRRQRH